MCPEAIAEMAAVDFDFSSRCEWMTAEHTSEFGFIGWLVRMPELTGISDRYFCLIGNALIRSSVNTDITVICNAVTAIDALGRPLSGVK